MKSLSFKANSVALLVAAFAVFGSACGGTSAKQNESNTAPAKAKVETKTVPAVVRDIPTYFEATGNLAGDQQTDVAPTVGGKIESVNFDVGSFVSKGDVLVRLDARDAQIRLEQALAQVEQQKKGVAQAEANAEQALAGLRQAQVRLGVKDGETFQIADFSQVKTVRAQLDLAEKELTRAERLLEKGDISKAIYDQRKSQRDALIGQMDEARSNAAVAIRAIDTARAAYQTALTAVQSARAAVATSQTAVDQARKALTDTSIYAPISGYVAERNADPGEFISPNVPNSKIATIVRTAVLRLRIDVPEQSISLVSVGQGVSAQVSAYPDRKFAGRIVRILPSINATSRTLTVEAEVENDGNLLKPGQFATVRITQSKATPAVMVPTTAIRTEGETNKVFVIKNGIAEERLVQLGYLENDLVEIKQGVREGENVATTNVEKINDGAVVNQ